MGRKPNPGWVFPAVWCLQCVLGCGPGTIDPECEDVCSPAGLSECAEGKVRSCLPDVPGCLKWSGWAPCGTGTCADGERCADCQNACSPAGTTDCTGGKTRTCVADDKHCLAWGESAACSSGRCLDGLTCDEATADTTPPSISITCPAPGTYSSQTISVSGIASDNIGISVVEVKTGSAGTWATATGTTSWSLSGLALAQGENTVYARATDASGKTNETSIAVTYSSSAPSGTLLWHGDFKSTDYFVPHRQFNGDSWGYGVDNAGANDANSIAPSLLPDRSGNGGKFTIKPGDYCYSPSCNQALLGHRQYKINDGDDRWYSVSNYLVPPFVTNQWIVIFGIKPIPCCYGTGIVIDKSGGSWMYKVCYNTLPTGGGGGTCKFVGDVQEGVWADWMIHIKWSKTNTGFIEAYQNDVLVHSHYDIQTIPTGQGVDYEHNIGLYRGADTTTLVAYIMNEKVGTTRSSVEYGGSSGNLAPSCTAPAPNPNPTPQSQIQPPPPFP